ncbi:3-ketoacyl-ACP synthase [bacterium DOLZORAL124_64_63]|nr:MAG: 3-ketoacyl-ACP synthase [bacterium DOLZORAL124_64_63]
MDRNARIVATGLHAPDRVVPNSYFNELLGEDVDTWLVENLSIRERRWLEDGEGPVDLCEGAARRILSAAGLAPEELDLIIISTDTPQYVSPSTASCLQHRLGARGAGTFDVNTACAGFVTALDMGAKYIRSDRRYDNVLVLGAYAMSRFLAQDDKKTATTFADGAAGVLLQAHAGPEGWQAANLHTEGQYHDWMGIYGGCAGNPATAEMVAAGDHLLKLVRKFPKEINPTNWTRMLGQTAREAGFTLQDVKKIFFTQININSIRETLESLGLGMERTHCVMDRFGYTGSACIPMCLAESDAAGDLRPGDKIMFMGSGGGLAFACAAFTW